LNPVKLITFSLYAGLLEKPIVPFINLCHFVYKKLNVDELCADDETQKKAPQFFFKYLRLGLGLRFRANFSRKNFLVRVKIKYLKKN
jgi:hypothetical protein